MVGAGRVGAFLLRAGRPLDVGCEVCCAGFSFWGSPHRDCAVCQGLVGCAESAGGVGLREPGEYELAAQGVGGRKRSHSRCSIKKILHVKRKKEAREMGEE